MTSDTVEQRVRRARHWRVVVLVGVSVLAGCASSAPRPAAAPVIEVPAGWAADPAADPAAGNPTATSLAQWWLRFDDPLLASLVGQARQANTSVTGAQAALRQARALRDVAAAGLLPAVGSSASAQRSMSGGLTSNANNVSRAGLDASWEVDVFGANRSALDASDATARASAASLGDVQVSIAAEVALS